MITAALCLGLTSCASKSARYVEAGGPNTVVSLDKINIQDFMSAADQMIDFLIASGTLSRAQRTPALMAISNIVNNTTQQMDTNMLTKKIRVRLNQTGLVQTLTTMGVGGTAEDTLARGVSQEREFYGDTSRTNPTSNLPDFTLSGRIIEDRARAGNIRQVSYVFQLSLTDTRTEAAVWEDEKVIVKQGTRPSVGW